MAAAEAPSSILGASRDAPNPTPQGFSESNSSTAETAILAYLERNLTALYNNLKEGEKISKTNYLRGLEKAIAQLCVI